MNENKLRILTIDDDEGDIEILRRVLDDVRDYKIELLAFTHWQQALDYINDPEPDLIFVDYRLGGETGIEVFRFIRRNGCESPVVMLTGQGSEMVAVEAMKAGVADYIIKENLEPENMLKVITNALLKSKLEKEVRLKQQQLEELARTDELTGLWNRRYLLERLIEHIQESLRYGFPLCLLMIDLDHFKHINDTYGHIVGDMVLKETARIIKKTIRRTDHAGRYGGEELCVILTNTLLESSQVVAERIREELSNHVFKTPSGEEFHVTCSIGVAQYHYGLDEISLLIDRADRALYAAKEAGRNRTVLETEIDFVNLHSVTV